MSEENFNIVNEVRDDNLFVSSSSASNEYRHDNEAYNIPDQSMSTLFSSSTIEQIIPNEYQQLIQKISHLNTTIQRSESTISKLQNENQFLKKQYKEATISLNTVQTRYSETRKSLLQQLDVTKRREEELDQVALNLMVQQKQQNDDQHKYRDSAGNKLPSSTLRHDVDMIRSQIRDELEDVYTCRLVSLENEVTKWQEQYHELRRKHEVSQSRVDALSEITTPTSKEPARSINANLQNELSCLKLTITKLTDEKGDDLRKLDAVRMSLTEAELRVSKLNKVEEALLSKIAEISYERDSLKMSKVEIESMHAARLQGEDTKCKAIQREISTLQHKVTELTKELESSYTLNKQLHEQLCNLETQRYVLQTSIDEKERGWNRVNEDLRLENQKCISEYTYQMNQMKDRLLTESNINNTLKKQLSDSLNVLDVQRKEAIMKENDYKKEMQQTLADTMKENVRLLKCLGDVEQNLENDANDKKDEIRRLKLQQETCQHEYSMMKKENESLLHRTSVSESAVDELKQKVVHYEEKLREASNGSSRLEKERNDTEDKLKDAEDQIQVLTSDLIHTKKQVDDLLNQINELNEVCETKQHNIMNSYNIKEKSLLTKLEKEKKKSEAYKQKAIEAHKKNIQAKHILAVSDSI